MSWTKKESVGTKHKFNCERVFKNYDLTCNRCLELKQGSEPRKGWQSDYYANKARQEAITSRAIHRHYLTPEGKADCAKNCGPVCVKFDY